MGLRHLRSGPDVLSDECVVTEERCVEPQPIGCAISGKTYTAGGPLVLTEGPFTLNEARENSAWFHTNGPRIMATSCEPIFVSLCDDPSYFVYATSFDSYSSSTVFSVDGTCSAAFVDAYFESDPYHNTLGEGIGRAEPEDNVCFQREPLVYTGPPELEACAQKGRDWLSTYVYTSGTQYPPCTPFRIDTCDPDICYVDETQ